MNTMMEIMMKIIMMEIMMKIMMKIMIMEYDAKTVCQPAVVACKNY